MKQPPASETVNYVSLADPANKMASIERPFVKKRELDIDGMAGDVPTKKVSPKTTERVNDIYIPYFPGGGQHSSYSEKQKHSEKLSNPKKPVTLTDFSSIMREPTSRQQLRELGIKRAANKVALVSTGDLGALQMLCDIHAPRRFAKLIIVDGRVAVIDFWRALQKHFENTNDERGFFLGLKVEVGGADKAKFIAYFATLFEGYSYQVVKGLVQSAELIHKFWDDVETFSTIKRHYRQYKKYVYALDAVTDAADNATKIYDGALKACGDSGGPYESALAVTRVEIDSARESVMHKVMSNIEKLNPIIGIHSNRYLDGKRSYRIYIKKYEDVTDYTALTGGFVAHDGGWGNLVHSRPGDGDWFLYRVRQAKLPNPKVGLNEADNSVMGKRAESVSDELDRKSGEDGKKSEENMNELQAWKKDYEARVLNRSDVSEEADVSDAKLSNKEQAAELTEPQTRNIIDPLAATKVMQQCMEVVGKLSAYITKREKRLDSCSIFHKKKLTKARIDEAAKLKSVLSKLLTSISVFMGPDGQDDIHSYDLIFFQHIEAAKKEDILLRKEHGKSSSWAVRRSHLNSIFKQAQKSIEESPVKQCKVKTKTGWAKVARIR